MEEDIALIASASVTSNIVYTEIVQMTLCTNEFRAHGTKSVESLSLLCVSVLHSAICWWSLAVFAVSFISVHPYG